jgi:hypothetical protein
LVNAKLIAEVLSTQADCILFTGFDQPRSEISFGIRPENEATEIARNERFFATNTTQIDYALLPRSESFWNFQQK